MPMSERSFLGLSAVGFHRVAYTQWGREDAARTVVCVHGLTRNGRDFDALALDLADRYRVACPDVVGRGKSGRLANPTLYGYPQYCADMAALIARLGVESVDWVGTSMGGLIGMLLAAQPDSPIRRLVVNDIGPFIPKAGLQRIADYVGKDPVFEDLAAVESYLRFVLMGFGRLSDEAWRHMAEHSARLRPDGCYGLAYDPAIAEAFKAQPMEDVDLWAVWDRIRCPVLVLRGATSDILPAETAEEMTRRGPKARLVEFAHTGHAPALMTGDQIAAVRDFLLEG
ncbi:alpha/beta fold hydrolase [Azospirillum brasilense]|nr:alpha/beta fold hydrolase [Azospirillum brasilense]